MRAPLLNFQGLMTEKSEEREKAQSWLCGWAEWPTASLTQSCGPAELRILARPQRRCTKRRGTFQAMVPHLPTSRQETEGGLRPNNLGEISIKRLFTRVWEALGNQQGRNLARVITETLCHPKAWSQQDLGETRSSEAPSPYPLRPHPDHVLLFAAGASCRSNKRQKQQPEADVLLSHSTLIEHRGQQKQKEEPRILEQLPWS